jgi:hypothetical protein
MVNIWGRRLRQIEGTLQLDCIISVQKCTTCNKSSMHAISMPNMQYMHIFMYCIFLHLAVICTIFFTGHISNLYDEHWFGRVVAYVLWQVHILYSCAWSQCLNAVLKKLGKALWRSGVPSCLQLIPFQFPCSVSAKHSTLFNIKEAGAMLVVSEWQIVNYMLCKRSQQCAVPSQGSHPLFLSLK